MNTEEEIQREENYVNKWLLTRRSYIDLVFHQIPSYDVRSELQNLIRDAVRGGIRYGKNPKQYDE